MHELEAYREPPGGDYVAFLEQLERQQLVKVVGTTTAPMAQPTTTAIHAGQEHPGQPSRPRATKLSTSSVSAAEGVAAAIGALMVFLSMTGEGNFITLIIGIALLWGPLQRLRRAARELSSRPTQSIAEQTFGKKKP